MIERQLAKFGWAILFVGTPLVLWAVSLGEVRDRWFALFPPFIGILLVLIHFGRSGQPYESKKRILRFGFSTLFIAFGLGMVLLARELVIRGTSLPFGWIAVGFGVAIAVFGVRVDLFKT